MNTVVTVMNSGMPLLNNAPILLSIVLFTIETVQQPNARLVPLLISHFQIKLNAAHIRVSISRQEKMIVLAMLHLQISLGLVLSMTLRPFTVLIVEKATIFRAITVVLMVRSGRQVMLELVVGF